MAKAAAIFAEAGYDVWGPFTIEQDTVGVYTSGWFLTWTNYIIRHPKLCWQVVLSDASSDAVIRPMIATYSMNLRTAPEVLQDERRKRLSIVPQTFGGITPPPIEIPHTGHVQSSLQKFTMTPKAVDLDFSLTSIPKLIELLTDAVDYFEKISDDNFVFNYGDLNFDPKINTNVGYAVFLRWLLHQTNRTKLITCRQDNYVFRQPPDPGHCVADINGSVLFNKEEFGLTSGISDGVSSHINFYTKDGCVSEAHLEVIAERMKYIKSTLNFLYQCDECRNLIPEGRLKTLSKRMMKQRCEDC